jgi:N-acetyl sugar amidotransferase
MDSSIPEVIFDDNCYCNFCNDLILRLTNTLNLDVNILNEQHDNLINKIKINGIGKKYDCVVGVSGGVDSSWVLVHIVKQGLRPLAVHMDNGWNSELAQNNINNLVTTLNVDLYTHVVDWDEYKLLMQSFFDADVVDIELLYDNAFLGVDYKIANKFNLKYIVSGSNISTEGMMMPSSWNHYKYDKKNIINIAKKFSAINKFTFPFFSTFDYLYYEKIKKIQWTSVLDLIDYDKDEALNHLESNYSFKRYPYKHYESIFTRFYQGYILPNKFNIDKRKLHLSTLICTNQITRSEAKKLLTNIPYNSQEDLSDDIEYFLKKMDWSLSDLETYIAREPVPHVFYGSELAMLNKMIKIKKFLNKFRF